MKIESIQNKECFVKMFDKEKIILSQIRAFKSTDIKSKSLYTKIANELISRSYIKKNASILELWAKKIKVDICLIGLMLGKIHIEVVYQKYF